MGAVAAKMTGLDKMRGDIAKLKKAVDAIKKITTEIEEKGKVITDGIDKAKQAKDQIEEQVGGITSKVEEVKNMSNGVQNNINDVQGLLNKANMGF